MREKDFVKAIDKWVNKQLFVKTKNGWLCLASDATHYYENFLTRKPFPIVVDVENMLKGFDVIQDLASDDSLIIPGHDPLVTKLFPKETAANSVGPNWPTIILLEKKELLDTLIAKKAELNKKINEDALAEFKKEESTV